MKHELLVAFLPALTKKAYQNEEEEINFRSG